MPSIQTISQLLRMQKGEQTENRIYSKLAAVEKNPENKKLLESIARDELRHAEILEKVTGQPVGPNRLKVWIYYLLARILGVTFMLRLMEAKEDMAQKKYTELSRDVPEVEQIINDEFNHEQELLSLLDEERLKYISSIVLGLNDALVELTGAIAGLTLALQNTRLIALVGLVTGISASLSMGASEYLSTKQEADSEKNPVKAAIYTTLAYLVAVVVLVAPFLIVSSHFTAVIWTLINALLLILIFTFYNSVARNLPLAKSYLEMATISMGVAAVSFGIGLIIRRFLGVDM